MPGMLPSQTTVAIVGGGPVGLISSILLSLNKIPHILFERQPSTSIHPKSVGLNQRTIEIFRKLGVEDDVLAIAAPASMSGRTAWYTSFGPNGREICSRECFGGGKYAEAHEKASPCRYVNLPQIRLEPILLRRARDLNPEGVVFGCHVDRLDERGDDVIVNCHRRGGPHDGEQLQIPAKYVLGADGGRALTDQLGITMNGQSDLVDMVTAHIRAPMTLHRPDQSVFLHWFIRPDLGGSIKTGAMYHLGPYPINTKTEEWVFACARLPHEQVRPFTEKDMIERIHGTLRIPDLEVELLSLSHWQVNAKVAAQFRSRGGRVFLLGDAAHRVPPWGALGLNSGVADAENLVWKLALALKHPELDLESLLDTYDLERRPIGERVARTSLYNMQAHALVLDKAIGLAPDRSVEENVRAIEQYFDPSDQSAGEAKRAAVDKALDVLDIEFYAHGAEVGWFYDLGYEGDYEPEKADRSNPQVKDDGEMELCDYHPTTRPGSQLPHAWLKHEGDEARASTKELVRYDSMVLLAACSAWSKIAHPLVQVIVIDEDHDDFTKADDSWDQVFGDIGASGALLVRPDGMIAFRFVDDAILREDDPQERVASIVRRVLRIEH